MYGGDFSGRRTPTPLNTAFRHLILVEGVEDGRLYEMACKFAGVSEAIEIRAVGGKKEFTNALKVLVALGQHLSTIAVIRDADDSPDSAFQSVCDALVKAKLPSPLLPGELSAEYEGRRTAVLVVPPHSPGCIESVCWDALYEHPIAACVEQFLQCARTNDPPSTLPPFAALDKTRVHVALAIGMNVSPSIRAGLRVGEASWNWSHPAFAPVLRFLTTVARK